MPSLVEAVASLAVSAAVFALLTAAMTAQVRLHASLVALAAESFAERQLEQLADRAFLAAGSGPGHPQPVTFADAENVVLAADTNGDGVVAASGAETTALELRQEGGDTRVRLRFGKQTMTVLEARETDAAFELVDRRGTPASPATTTLVSIAWRKRDDGASRRMLFALPQRALP